MTDRHKSLKTLLLLGLLTLQAVLPLYADLVQVLRATPVRLYHSLAFSPDGRYLAASAFSGYIFIWRLADGKIVHALEQRQESIGKTWIINLAYLCEGKYLVAADPGQVKIWSTGDGSLFKVFTNDLITGQLASAPDAASFVIHQQVYTNKNRTGTPVAEIFSLATAPVFKLQEKFRLEGQKIPPGFVFTPDGQHLAVGAAKGEVRIHNMQNGQVTHTYSGPKQAVTKIEFTPDGRKMAAAGNRELWVWHYPSGKPVPAEGSIAQDHRAWLLKLFSLCPGGELFIVFDGTGFHYHRLDTGEGLLLQGVLFDEMADDAPAVFSPDGRYMAAACQRVIRVWDSPVTEVEADLSAGREQSDIYHYYNALPPLPAKDDLAGLAAQFHGGTLMGWEHYKLAEFGQEVVRRLLAAGPPGRAEFYKAFAHPEPFIQYLAIRVILAQPDFISTYKKELVAHLLQIIAEARDFSFDEYVNSVKPEYKQDISDNLKGQSSGSLLLRGMALKALRPLLDKALLPELIDAFLVAAEQGLPKNSYFVEEMIGIVTGMNYWDTDFFGTAARFSKTAEELLLAKADAAAVKKYFKPRFKTEQDYWHYLVKQSENHANPVLPKLAAAVEAQLRAQAQKEEEARQARINARYVFASAAEKTALPPGGCTDNNPLFSIIGDQGIGFINLKGEVVIEPGWFMPINETSFACGLLPVKIEGRWGYINKQGKLVTKPDYGQKGGFTEGLAAVLTHSGWGYINTAGEMVIPPAYQRAGHFREGLALVSQGTRQGYINYRGEMVIDADRDILPQLHSVKGKPNRVLLQNDFSDGMAAFRDASMKNGFINTRGEVIVQPLYASEFAYFFNGLAVVEERSKYQGVIDKEGNLVIPINQWDLRLLGEGLVAAKSNSNRQSDTVIIDTRRKAYITEPGDYWNIGYFSEGLCAATGKNGRVYVNPTWQEVIHLSFPGITSTMAFYNGLARVCTKEEHFFINTKGERAFDLHLKRAGDFREELVSGRLPNGESVYINRQGEIVRQWTPLSMVQLQKIFAGQ